VSAAASSAAASQASPAVVAGTVPAPSGDTRHAKIQKKTAKGWETIGSAEVRADGTFDLSLPRTKYRHTIRVRVLVPGVGKSKTMKVRL
jgi:hypothetical protein